MPRKKQQDPLDDLHGIFALLPWWVPLPVAALCYAFMRDMVPLIWHEKGLAAQLISPVSVMLAPYVAGTILLVGVSALLGKAKRRALLDHQTGLNTIRQMSWRDFELLIGEAYRRQGYTIEERGGSGGDGGVDLVLRRHGQMTLVQCKRWRTRQVGVAVIRELYGVMASEGAAGGIIVACGYFTPDALAFAQGKPLQLVGGNELLELIRRGQVQASVTAKVIPSEAPHPASPMPGQVVKPISEASGPPFCPMCRQPLLLRRARQGPNAGNEFWGCSDYPRCRGARQI